MQECEPRYRPPNRQTFTNLITGTLYQEELAKLKKEISQAVSVAITADGWTSRAPHHYMTITAHYIYQWKLQSKVLQTKRSDLSQTGMNIGHVIKECMQTFSIDGKVDVLTVDNASNMDLAARECGINYKLGCFPHTLNLAANKIFGNKELVSMLSKIRPIITYFHKSSIACAVLKEKQLALSLPVHKLILDCKTRWNSTYFMVERFNEQLPAVIAALLDARLKKESQGQQLQNVSQDERDKADAFLQLMSMMYTCTQALCTDNNPTAGLILPILLKLEKHFAVSAEDSPFIAGLKSEMLKNLKIRYQVIINT